MVTFVESFQARRTQVLWTSGVVLTSAGVSTVLPTGTMGWFLALMVTGWGLVRAGLLFQLPLGSFNVSSAQVTWSGLVPSVGSFLSRRGSLGRLDRAAVTAVTFLSRPSWSGPMVSQVGFVLHTGQVVLVPVRLLRVSPLEMVSVFNRASWPVPGAVVAGGDGDAVRVPSGWAVAGETARSMGLVVGLAMMMIVVFDGFVWEPLVALTGLFVFSWLMVTVTAVARVGFHVRVRFTGSEVTVEDVSGVAVFPAESVAAVGVRNGCLAVRLVSGTVMRLSPPVTARVVGRAAYAAVSHGLSWEPDLI